jgi:hypothetical protein
MLEQKATLNPEKQIGNIPGPTLYLALTFIVRKVPKVLYCFNVWFFVTSLMLLTIQSFFLVSFHSSGVEVGQQFLSRAEMVVIGLHSHWLNGIDYIGVGKGKVRLQCFLKSLFSACFHFVH